MELDCYRVKVLYYLNPHLIWVEVHKPDITNSEDLIFEQIGLYGLLPMDMTIDFADQSLKSYRSSSWAPAVASLMKAVLSNAEEVVFMPAHVEKKSSIFDSNVHKYGELIIKEADGTFNKLSSYLEKSDFVLQDAHCFEQELSLGNIKTTLHHFETQDVVTHLENYYLQRNVPKKYFEKSLKKQMSVFFAAECLTSALTVENLQKHNHILEKAPESIKKERVSNLLERKFKDLSLCKDIDDTSFGRSSLSRDKCTKKLGSAVLLKRNLELMKLSKHRLDVNCDTVDLLNDAKNSSESMTMKNDTSDEKVKQINTDDDEFYVAVPKVVNVLKSEKTKNADQSDLQSPQNYKKIDFNNIKNIKRGRKHRDNKITEYDTEKEICVAFGPPGVNISKLSFTILPKNYMDGCDPTENPVEIPDESKPYSMLADKEDSEDEFVIKSDLLGNVNKKQNDAQFLFDSNKVKQTPHNIMTNKTLESAEGSCKEQKTLSRVLQSKLSLCKSKSKSLNSTLSSASDTSNKDSSTSVEEAKIKKRKEQDQNEDEDESINDKVDKVHIAASEEEKGNVQQREEIQHVVEQKKHVNPFRNVDDNISVFVDKLVSPILMVHNKMNKRIKPQMNLRDIPFSPEIQTVLKNMNITSPVAIQTVSWLTILRGYSVFMISPSGTGKTLGYIPSICRLIASGDNGVVDSVGPMCIIVCATAQSLAEIEKLCKLFFGLHDKIIACYPGMDELHITTSLLNGCHLFICTPSVLTRLLQRTDCGIDLRRLSIVVFDDCERLLEVYSNEIKFFLVKIKEMLKKRVNKELYVQYVVASRIWCDFIESLAKKLSNSVICIGAFQECVLYSKVNTTVKFVNSSNKIKAVLEFLKEIDTSKRTVIICSSDDEVVSLNETLKRLKYITFACNSNMTVQELCTINVDLENYQGSVLGPILICCDGNLAHLNVTNAHYLFHYSLPELFTMFRKRFSVLNDNYPSLFNDIQKEEVKIEILLDESNVEELPKILNFIKRCTTELPEFLNDICEKILAEKDIVKAKTFVPICDNLLALGECPDFWNCKERHAILKEYDDSKEWMPKNGEITFRMLHYHSAISYSGRLISNIQTNHTKKYPQNYSMLSLKMGMYYSTESNKKLHGIPKIGDICAVSIKPDLFVRCQVVKILSKYQRGAPKQVLIRLIDEERYEITSDIYLHHLPQDLANIETHVVQVILGNLQPKDKDITFSDLVRDQLKKITDQDDDIYMKGKVVMTIGNCVIVDTLEACQDLKSLKESIVKYNFKEELLSKYGIPNPDHISNLKKLCKDININVTNEDRQTEIQTVVKGLPKEEWAFFENDDIIPVFFASAASPDQFFVRLVKFESCMNHLLTDIEIYVSELKDNVPMTNIRVGDLVLAKFPDDSMYERARIDHILDSRKVKCFFVDKGDWREVLIKDLAPITEKFITQLPFQAIECRLIGVKPAGNSWTDFATNWFCDQCYDSNDEIKCLYVKYFTKESANITNGYKYGVAIVDTNSDEDLVINNLIIDLNLAKEDENEIKYLHDLNFIKLSEQKSKHNKNGNDNEFSDNELMIYNSVKNNNIAQADEKSDISQTPLNILQTHPIRSVPLIACDDGSSDGFEINWTNDFTSIFSPMNQNIT